MFMLLSKTLIRVLRRHQNLSYNTEHHEVRWRGKIVPS